ncbi:MAG: biliverdin-producing heme oxygenase [Methylobacterium frigidaeris]
MSVILARLRAETRDAHEAIERDLAWESRVATRTGYRSLLERFFGFHAVFEPAVAAALADDALFEPRRKLERLSDDLRFHGLAPAAIAALPRPRRCWLPATRPEALGALYVTEGSTLGGQLIARHVERRLGLDGAGSRYHRSYGKAVGAMWTEFRRHLDGAVAADPDCAGAIVAGANRTFSDLRAWLCEVPVEA